MSDSGLRHIKQRSFNIIDKATIKAKEAVMAEEDRKIFDSIQVSMCPEGTAAALREQERIEG